MKQEGWLVGDGGPFVILGVVDCAWWDGSGDHENSLMEGGTVETDYDVICSVNPGAVVTIRGSSLVVAFDSSEGGAFLNVDGRLVFVQPLALPEERFDPERDVQPHELQDFVSERLRLPPDATHEMVVRDTRLRLIVGADGGDGGVWGFREAAISRKGRRQVDVYFEGWELFVVDFGEP